MLAEMLGRRISHSSNDKTDDNSCNESLAANTDAQGMFLKPHGRSHFGDSREKQHLTIEGAAE